METECQEKIHHPYRAILRAMSRRYTVRSVSVRFERRRARARLRVVFVSPHAPVGPTMVDTHSYKLSPFGPALQFVGGSSEISANSFWMRLALLDSELFFSLIRPSLASSPSFLRSFLRSVASLAFASRRASRLVSSRVASRLVSSRLGRRLRASHTHVETTTTGRRQFKVIIIITSSSSNEDETKQKHSRSSAGGGGCKPYFRCVYQTDMMLVCGVILYDPNVRDYIHIYTDRQPRRESVSASSVFDVFSSEAWGRDDDGIERTIDSSIDGGRVSCGRRRR